MITSVVKGSLLFSKRLSITLVYIKHFIPETDYYYQFQQLKYTNLYQLSDYQLAIKRIKQLDINQTMLDDLLDEYLEERSNICRVCSIILQLGIIDLVQPKPIEPMKSIIRQYVYLGQILSTRQSHTVIYNILSNIVEIKHTITLIPADNI